MEVAIPIATSSDLTGGGGEVPVVSAPDLSIAPNAIPETVTTPPKEISAMTEEFKVPFAISTPRGLPLTSVIWFDPHHGKHTHGRV